MNCPDFTNFLHDFDIICIQESRLDDIDRITFPGYKTFMHNRKPIARYRSGGIALLIKEEYEPFIHVRKAESKLVFWFEISKQILKTSENLVCGVIYIPPHGSKYAHADPYLELQNEIDRVCGTSKHVILLGDFNSRTAKLCDYTKCDEFIFDLQGHDSLYAENMHMFQVLQQNNITLNRQNLDTRTNAYGHQMIEFCKNNNLFILNGRLDAPKLTCKNASTVDYIVSSAYNFPMFSSFEVLEFDSLFSDAHCALKLQIDIHCLTQIARTETLKCGTPDIKLWDDSKQESFASNLDYGEILNIEASLDLMAAGYNLNSLGVDRVVNLIENLFKNTALSSFGRKKQHTQDVMQNYQRKAWFNAECREARSTYHKIRKMYNKHKTLQYKTLLKAVSKEYKNKMAKNVRRYKNHKIEKLKTLKHAKPREYWKLINSTDEKNKSMAPLQDLYNYFKNINRSNEEESENTHSENDTINEQHSQNINNYVNQPFTDNEIIKAVKNLKNNKSSGTDSILNEHIKATINIMASVYTKLFNIIFDSGLVPESWTLGDIIPIYKNKGSITDPVNYRPITLLSCLGKLFTSILNTRITKYVEESNIIDHCQAGFREGFSTLDNLFILQNLIDISKSQKTKFYCAFIDFKQAFDKVWRNGLWEKLLKTKINGKCLRIIKNMYNNIKSRVSTREGASAFFPCETGVRQGENLSPLLFSIYLNDLSTYLEIHNAPAVECETYAENIYIYTKLFILLFADDTVLFGLTKEDLQTTLNVFENYCDEWRLTVNIQKTKVLVFSSGRIPKNLNFFFKNQEIEIVTEYKYLGVYVARSGSFLRAKKHIVDQANLALFSLLRKIRTLGLPIHMQIDLFDKMVKPVLLYGCELWGFGNIKCIERVQLKFLKYILNLKKSTPCFMVYGEVGVFPLSVEINSRIVNYWAKLHFNRKNQIATDMYGAIRTLSEQGRMQSKWLINVKDLVNRNGYGNIWTSNEAINVKWLAKSFKQKQQDQYIQTWSSLVDQSSSGTNYRIFKDKFRMNDYIKVLSNKQVKTLTAFRTRNHRLPVEIGRWSSIPLNERMCFFCDTEIGDEFHYIFKCPQFSESRSSYIKPFYRRHPNTYKYNLLMNSNNKKVLGNLCKFIDNVMKTIRDRS